MNTENNLNELLACWPFDEGKGNIATNKVTGKSQKINYVFNEAKFKTASDPVWTQGMAGNALLFDGYSTWIEDNHGVLQRDLNKLTLEVWVAPRCSEYNENNNMTSIINQLDEEKIEGFTLGLKEFGRVSFKIGSNGSWYELEGDKTALPLYKWSHVIAVFDGQKGLMELYIDGNRITYKNIPVDSVIAAVKESLFIGKNNKSTLIEGIYDVSCYCGILDEIKVYERAVSAAEVEDKYNAYIEDWKGELPLPDISIDRNIYEGDKYRPVYHFISPGYWMNEPHGPLCFNGQYHLFFQHNPHGPLWRQIHWGHVVSDDMVHWRDVPCALVPGKDEIDTKGDWSGCTIVDSEGVPNIIYTAGDGPIYSQCVAVAKSTFKEDGNNDLVNWIKQQVPIIIQEKNMVTEKGEVHFGQFRDPFVWQEEDTYYGLIGSGIKDSKGSVGGTALLYTSKDLQNWKYEKPLYVGDYKKNPKTGEVWELPVFLPVGIDKEGREKYVLLVNPWFFEPSPHNVKYVWYWIGYWDNKSLTFMPDSDEPELIDVGEHFTGPSGLVDPKGRTIIFTIAQDKRSGLEHVESGWAHNGGLPVSLYLREDGRLGIEPIVELKTLREAVYAEVHSKSLKEVNKALEVVKDDCIEIQLELEMGNCNACGIKLRRTPGGEEETLLYYNREIKEILIDRNKSSLSDAYEKGIQGGKADIGNENLRLHIFIDKSMIEAYVNNLKGLTSRAYPTREDALELCLWADREADTVKVKSLTVWKLKSAYQN